jgi:hypothetical protein
MVLADDNFASIVAAVREGRTVYDNIRKVIGWTLPTNGGEALVIVAGDLLRARAADHAVQILWVNMVTAVTLGLALAFEPTEPGVMRRPPRAPGQPLLRATCCGGSCSSRCCSSIGAFGMFFWAQERGLEPRGGAHDRRQHDRGHGDLLPVQRPLRARHVALLAGGARHPRGHGRRRSLRRSNGSSAASGRPSACGARLRGKARTAGRRRCAAGPHTGARAVLVANDRSRPRSSRR